MRFARKLIEEMPHKHYPSPSHWYCSSMRIYYMELITLLEKIFRQTLVRFMFLLLLPKLFIRIYMQYQDIWLLLNSNVSVTGSFYCCLGSVNYKEIAYILIMRCWKVACFFYSKSILGGTFFLPLSQIDISEVDDCLSYHGDGMHFTITKPQLV